MATLQDYYAARAPEYDRVYLKPERQSDLRAIEAWLPPLFAGTRVLEIACGTGYWTQFFAPVASTVLAIDAAPETLRIAGDRVAEGKVRFVVGDAYAPPADTPKRNAAFAGFWLSHVPRSRVREFLVGLNAVLEPGSRVVLLDNRFVDGNSSPISGSDAEGNTFQERALGDGSVHRVLKNFPSDEELRSQLEGIATAVEYKAWSYFWAVNYTTKAA